MALAAPSVSALRGAAQHVTFCTVKLISNTIKECFLFAIIQAAGWPIWPLLIASIVGLALIVERSLYLRRARILPPHLLQEVIKVYQGGKVKTDVIDKLEQNSP